MACGPVKLSDDERECVGATLEAYARGWFPMYDPGRDEVQWVQPRQRGLLPLEEGRFVVSRSLRGAVRSGRFEVTGDRAFGEVIRACSRPGKGRESTWLDESIIGLFELLHRAGYAHSVEAWVKGERGPVLVGGLYGLAVGSVFCGESMFSDPAKGGTNASKVCLVHLVGHLRRRGFTVLDAQLSNDHLEQFGLYEMEQGKYVAMLAVAAGEKKEWGEFEGVV